MSERQEITDEEAARVGRMCSAALEVSSDPQDMMGLALVLLSMVADTAASDRDKFLADIAEAFPQLPRVDWDEVVR